MIIMNTLYTVHDGSRYLSKPNTALPHHQGLRQGGGNAAQTPTVHTPH